MLLSALVIALSLVGSSLVLPARGSEDKPGCSTPTSCFPALGFKMPERIPETMAGWWCDMCTEYAFVGISYEVTSCESASHHTDELFDADFVQVRAASNSTESLRTSESISTAVTCGCMAHAIAENSSETHQSLYPYLPLTFNHVTV